MGKTRSVAFERHFDRSQKQPDKPCQARLGRIYRLCNKTSVGEKKKYCVFALGRVRKKQKRTYRQHQAFDTGVRPPFAVFGKQRFFRQRTFYKDKRVSKIKRLKRDRMVTRLITQILPFYYFRRTCRVRSKRWRSVSQKSVVRVCARCVTRAKIRTTPRCPDPVIWYNRSVNC